MAKRLRTFPVLLAVVALFGCANDATSASNANDEQQSGALGSGQDACVTACTDERGIELTRCEALCSEPSDASCYTTCMTSGGTSESCRMECYAVANCHARCLSEGGDEAACRPECAREKSPGTPTDIDACIRRCVDAGGDQASCRASCSQSSDTDSTTDDACSSAASDAYENCMADEGEVEFCRQAAADAYNACISAQ